MLSSTVMVRLAAMADTHFSVEKGSRGTYLHPGGAAGPCPAQQELARLTGGASISATMLEGAGELLDQAEKFKKTLA